MIPDNDEPLPAGTLLSRVEYEYDYLDRLVGRQKFDGEDELLREEACAYDGYPMSMEEELQIGLVFIPQFLNIRNMELFMDHR